MRIRLPSLNLPMRFDGFLIPLPNFVPYPLNEKPGISRGILSSGGCGGSPNLVWYLVGVPFAVLVRVAVLVNSVKESLETMAVLVNGSNVAFSIGRNILVTVGVLVRIVVGIFDSGVISVLPFIFVMSISLPFSASRSIES